MKQLTTVLARHLHAAELWLHEIHPTWSLTRTRARVIDVVRETADVKTFVLEPSWRWHGHRAGQYTMLEIERNGVRMRRCYSISSAPSDPQLAITVKRVAGGAVSTWLHDHLGPGDVVGLGAAAGDFVLPEDRPGHPPARLLLITGGSGITPAMSMLRDLAGRGAVDDIVFVHHARSRADVIFGAELAALAVRHPGVRLAIRTDDDGGGFDEAELARAVPDFAARSTYLCGPPGLMTRVEAMWQRAGATLRRERFTQPAALPPGDGESVQVRLARAGRHVAIPTATTLLDALERAGERPTSGCRIGICHTCTRRKHRGTVRNLVDGAVSSEPDVEIQLCVSVACSDLELDL